MSYDLPISVDTYPKTFAVPAAQIPAGLAINAGLPFLQFNQHRCGLWLLNNAAAGSFVWISEVEFGFATAFPIQGSAFFNVLEFPFPPRVQMFAWTTGTAPDFRYMEFVYQPFRQGVPPEKGGGIRSNVQHP
jgi:hypothetical protein